MKIIYLPDCEVSFGYNWNILACQTITCCISRAVLSQATLYDDLLSPVAFEGALERNNLESVFPTLQLIIIKCRGRFLIWLQSFNLKNRAVSVYQVQTFPSFPVSHISLPQGCRRLLYRYNIVAVCCLMIFPQWKDYAEKICRNCTTEDNMRLIEISSKGGFSYKLKRERTPARISFAFRQWNTLFCRDRALFVTK